MGKAFCRHLWGVKLTGILSFARSHRIFDFHSSVALPQFQPCSFRRRPRRRERGRCRGQRSCWPGWPDGQRGRRRPQGWPLRLRRTRSVGRVDLLYRLQKGIRPTGQILFGQLVNIPSPARCHDFASTRARLTFNRRQRLMVRSKTTTC